MRLAHTRFAKASFWGRLTNMVTFLAAATWKCATLGRADAVVVETDPPLLCLLGRWLQITRRCKLVCYLQDIYPDVAVALGKLSDNLLTRFIDRIFYAVYRRSDGVIVLSRDMQRHMESRGIAASRIHCIPNWIDTRRIVPRQTDNAFRAAHQLADKFVVMYSGNLGFSQRLEHVIEAADRLRGDSRFEFVLIGNGANRAPLEDLVRQLGLANTRFFDYQPKSQLAESLSAADVHIVFLDPRITHCLMPSKIYGVLATGSVALVLGESTSELAQMVITNQVGRVVAADDAEAIVGAIRDLASEPDFCRAAGIRARDLAVKRFDRQVARQQFRSMMRDVLGESQLQFGASSA